MSDLQIVCLVVANGVKMTSEVIPAFMTTIMWKSGLPQVLEYMNGSQHLWFVDAGMISVTIPLTRPIFF